MSVRDLLKLIDVDDLRFVLPVPGHALARRLRELLWYYPNEQFAAMAQRAVEDACVRLARNVVRRTDCASSRWPEAWRRT